MKLYLLETSGLGIYYIIANTATEAENYLIEQLDNSDYGFSDQRKVHAIKVIAEEIIPFQDDKLNFSSKNKLLIKK